MTNVTIYTSAKSAAATRQPGETTIVCNFKAPARTAIVNVSNEAWTAMEQAVPEGAYRAICSAVLTAAAKKILSDRVGNMTVIPSEVESVLFTADAILDAAQNSGLGMLTKPEALAAWEASATRRKLMEAKTAEGATKYTDSKSYRQAVDKYMTYFTQLCYHKAVSIEATDLDWVLSKMEPEDQDTDAGALIAKRAAILKAKPMADSTDYLNAL